MTNKISAAEYLLSKIFTSDFDFIIPRYQRPYSWTADQAEELFNDLWDAYENREESYFLGSIVLIKQDKNPLSEVVDGQQRLTTLTILIAALAETVLHSGNSRIDFQKYIIEAGDVLESLESKPRLTLRDRDAKFFKSYVQEFKLRELIKLDTSTLDNESQVNIHDAAAVFIKKIGEYLSSEKNLLQFGKFLMTNCYLVAVSTPSEQSAFKIFSVMNNRGLDLQDTDILKADIIGKIDEKNREQYSLDWEQTENELGRRPFNELFSYIRMIFAKQKAKKSVREEFKDYVLSQFKNKEKELIDDIILPYSEAMSCIQKECYQSSSGNAGKINDLFAWLKRTENSDWIPVALFFLAANKNNSTDTLWFFEKLERLAAYIHISGMNINDRIIRYGKLLSEMECVKDLNFSNLNHIELSKEEMAAMYKILDGDIYKLTPKRRNYIILRLDSFTSDGSAVYSSSKGAMTIEHVLPQTVPDNSEWTSLWPNQEQRDQWLHKISNLVPLNFKRNIQAQNYDFEKKKNTYFKGSKNASSYILTSQVLNAQKWTPEFVEERQSELMKRFCDNWSIDKAA